MKKIIIQNIRLHQTQNSVFVTVDTPNDTYEYSYKNYSIAAKNINAIIEEIDMHELSPEDKDEESN